MFNFAVICLCIGIALIDLKTYRIPDILLAFFVPVMFISDSSRAILPVSERVFTAFMAFIFFGAVWYFTNGIGFGDVKYAAVLGYVLGLERIFSAFIFTALLGIIIYAIGIIVYRWPKTTKIPFGPFLSAGAILSLGII
ncbi:MAG: A24 family peptidase [Treponema sp.]|jgi:leader peptidase (prepilin peptidase)/N-methyltransferase|nr:A24 family peptidase [Treponema sp.]